MSPEISERAFEATIECALLQYGPDACASDTNGVREAASPYGDTPPGGYRKRRQDDYDRTLCLLPRDLVDFVLATQPKEWKKLEQHHGSAVKEQFLKRVAAEIERRGTLDVLRNGIKDSGCKFRLAYFRPASGLNEETRRLHAANLFAVVRQVHYSTKNSNSLDLVLFLNGIPIFTAELKNLLNRQGVKDIFLLRAQELHGMSERVRRSPGPPTADKSGCPAPGRTPRSSSNTAPTAGH